MTTSPLIPNCPECGERPKPRCIGRIFSLSCKTVGCRMPICSCHVDLIVAAQGWEKGVEWWARHPGWYGKRFRRKATAGAGGLDHGQEGT